MVVHHVATVMLMYFSWIMNFVRVGTLVLLVHDAADSWLAVSIVQVIKHFSCSTHVSMEFKQHIDT